MPDQMFGRRGRTEVPKSRVFRTEIAEPVQVVIAKPRMTGGQIALGVLALIVGVSILGHAMKGQDVTSAGATYAKIIGKPSAPRKCGATLAEFQALQTGMTVNQAVGIIGCQGTEMSHVALAGQESVMFTWDGETGFIADMNATFDNGRLVAKVQLGLE